MAQTPGRFNHNVVPAPPSVEASREILRRAIDHGGLTWSRSFQTKCLLLDGNPGFNTVDATRVLRSGKIVFGPSYDETCHSWRYELCDRVENRKFVLIVLLDCGEDFHLFPIVTIKSGYFGKPRRKGNET